MKARVFITGGSGLLALNWSAIIRDRIDVTLGIHERQVSPPGIKTIRVSLDSVEGLVRILESLQSRIVIHTAGLTSVEKCEADPELAKYINIKLAANVAKACSILNLDLVHISTDHLFSGDISLVEETYPVAPLNVYGKTKAEAELRVIEAHSKALVIRTNFYGWGTNYRRSFSDMVIQGLRAGKELILFEDVAYTPILAETVAKCVHDLIDLGASGIFHVSGDDRLSKYEFGLMVSTRFNLNSSLIKAGLISDQASLIQRPLDMSLSNRKTSGLLGRRLGGVSDHLVRLFQQEQNGFAQELQRQ